MIQTPNGTVEDIREIANLLFDNILISSFYKNPPVSFSDEDIKLRMEDSYYMHMLQYTVSSCCYHLRGTND